MLVSQSIFMTCSVSDDLVLSGDQAWQYYKKKLTETDFPLRRVARLLTARSLLTFLLDCLSADVHGDYSSSGAERTVPSIDALQFLRAGQQFRALVATDLSDDVLQDWLADMER